MKHKIIAIGYLGDFTCYLDVPMEEAKRRYLENNEELRSILEVDFDDEFTAYDIQQNPY